MKLRFNLPRFLSSLLLLSSLVVALGRVESSVDESVFNITRGSSISTYSPNNEESNTTNSSYWLSPSGNIAFGFYPLCSNSPTCGFIVGIWFIKSADKTLVWTANRNDPPVHHPSSILLNNDGNLVLQTGDGKVKPLLHDMWEPASYAVMLDNGNLVLYGSNSTIIWESFDYPTDTILGGQTLKSKQSLIASLSKFEPSFGRYELRIEHYNCDVNCFRICYYRYGDCGWDREVLPMIMNLDSTTGQLYVVDWNDNKPLKIITKGELNPPQQQEGSNVSTNIVLYRATLDVDGYFRLYKERIGIEGEKSILLWPSGGTKLLWSLVTAGITLGISFMFSGLFLFN